MRAGSLFLWLLIAPAAGFGQAAPPSLTVAAGLDGYYTVGRWVPVRVLAENQNQDFSGAVVIQWGTTTYRQAVTLASPSRKQLEFHVRAADSRETLRVTLRDRDGTAVVTRDVPVRGVLPAEPLHVVVDTPAAPLGSVHAAFVASHDLPSSWRGYDGVDEVHIAASTERLQPAQAAALERWRAVRGVDHVTDLRAAVPAAAGASSVDGIRWQFLALYGAALAGAFGILPVVLRRASIAHTALAAVALAFVVFAGAAGRVAAGATESRRIVKVHATPHGTFVTALAFARPEGRTEARVPAALSEALVEAAPDAPPHEIHYSERGDTLLAISGSLGETFSAITRGFSVAAGRD